MRANNSHLGLNDERKKEYERQQEKLKAMANPNDKVKTVSADIMIENLLKDSFKKPQVSPNVEQVDQNYSELPLWLQCDSVTVPAQYKYLWTLVQLNNNLADTQKVSQLLLTSGLHVDVLGFIWNLANKAIPGQLTKQEFFIVLAFVALAQTGCTFTNASVLKILPGPALPVLQADVLKNLTPQLYTTSSPDMNTFQDFQSCSVTHVISSQGNSVTQSHEVQGKKSNDLYDNEVSSPNNFVTNIKKEKHELNLFYDVGVESKPSKSNESYLAETKKGSYKSSNFPCIGSSPTAEMEDDFTEFQFVPAVAPETHSKPNNSEIVSDTFDDFTDFQSANINHPDPFETVVIRQKREIPKIPLPKTLSGKFTTLKSNILKISPESERKLKILSKPESLVSLPESKISSSNKVSTSISVLGTNQEIGCRLANHSLGAKLDRPKHHKHHKIKINPTSIIQPDTEEEVILGVKTTNTQNLMPKCSVKKSSNSKTFVLKETKIRNDELPELPPFTDATENNMQIAGENTRKIEIPMLGTFNETTLPTEPKPATSGVDLISVQEDKYSALREIDLELKEEKIIHSEPDDFGEFLSAEISTAPNSEPNNSLSQSNLLAPSTSLTTESSNTPSVSLSSALDIDFPPVQKISSPLTQLSPVQNIKLQSQDNFEDWGDWNFNTESVKAINDSKEKNNVPPKQLPVKEPADIFDSFSLLDLNESENPLKSTEANVTVIQEIFTSIEPSLSSADNSILPPGKEDNNGMPIIDLNKNDKNDSLVLPSKPEPLTKTNNLQSDIFWDFMEADSNATSKEGLSRHGSLPSLDLKMSATEETEQDIVWRKCTESCQNLIQEALDIFNNVSNKSILDEVFTAEKTIAYLNYLNVVYQISKRVSKNFTEIPLVQENVEKLWNTIEEFCIEYNIKLKPDEDSSFMGSSQCNICRQNINNDSITQGNSIYHPSCANLWVNFIEDVLPFSS